ncbi:MAG: hypothetical protein ABWZ75_00810 [Novosphingobium sp.]
MIQPSALPAAPAITPVATMQMAAGETGEADDVAAGFAAMLGVRLEATASKEEPAAPIVGLPVAAPAVIVPEGKALPHSLLPVAAIKEEDLPKLVESDEIQRATTALPVLQIMPTADTPAPAQQAGSPPTQEARPAPSTMMPAAAALPVPSPPRSETATVSQTPVAAPLPQLAISVPEEKSRPAAADPIRTLTAAQQAEVSAAPAATFQPVVTAPQVSAPAAAQRQAQHDFATLVDRLVEARDTALTVQTPQSVAAAVTHSDFGEVSIRFEHRGDALSVSLASADPDFTRAVQAAAPAAQANTAGDDHVQQHQRHEGGGQQLTPGSGNSQQSQPQQRQGSASARTPIQQEPDGEQKQPNGSIFA